MQIRIQFSPPVFFRGCRTRRLGEDNGERPEASSALFLPTPATTNQSSQRGDYEQNPIGRDLKSNFGKLKAIDPVEVQHEKPVNVSASVQNIKEYMTKVIKDQSSKIQTLLRKIQYNAQMVLTKIKLMNQNQKPHMGKKTYEAMKPTDDADNQIESPISEDTRIADVSTKLDNARSFSNHYVSTGYGASGSANSYGVSTYHHHSIGFDPINIVVSMSLISFLFQALQGFFARTRLPTPVVEAKRLDSRSSEKWNNKLEEKKRTFTKKNSYLTKKLYKNNLH
ncbi:jg24543 [Pararge aegeria aegeria]|uniref:Jg24543 protein n=1 Tax=Pararge aegeria aegeria TaxID=348720 RepID=A0A8S4SR66_9NEOP|nr:jg24543 [Pararge aegeria aegeria]